MQLLHSQATFLQLNATRHLPWAQISHFVVAHRRKLIGDHTATLTHRLILDQVDSLLSVRVVHLSPDRTVIPSSAILTEADLPQSLV